MLKIHSFLRKMKDAISGTIWTMIKKHSRHMSIAVYAVTAVVLVLHFNPFTGYSTSTLDCAVMSMAGQITKVEAAEESNDNEETKVPETTVSGIAKYPSLLINESFKLNIFPLGQVYAGNVSTNLEDASAVMAVTTAKEQQELLAREENLQLFSVNEDETKKTVTAKNSSEAASVISSDIVTPENLSLVTNKSMIKKLSKDELAVLQRIVEAEATGEDVFGKILVANVVLNRVNSKQFPNTVSEVVFQKSGSSYQFSPTKDGRYWSVKITDSTVEAVSRALSGEDYSHGALFFFARRLTSQKKASWFDNSLKKVVQYGCHEFYKNK